MLTDFFWKKLNLITGLMAIAGLFGLTAFAANLEIKDLDLWLHLKTGQYIVTHHMIPDHDVLSCSIAGKPWINHEWLFQVIIVTIHQLFGFDGLIGMQVGIVCLTFMFLLLIVYRKDRQTLSVLCLLLVLLVYQSRFTIRPDIFSLLFFALNMFVLAGHLHKRWSLWVLVVVQLLWVNMHGFFILGPLCVLIGILAECIKRWVPLPYEWNSVGRLTDVEFKRLIVIFFALIGVSFINPYMIAGALYPINVIFQPKEATAIFFEHILELQRPFRNGVLEGDIHYKILIISSFMSFVFNRRKIDVGIFMLWFVFLLFSLAAIRNLIFFSCVAYLVILVNSLRIVWEDIVPVHFTTLRFKELSEIMIKCGLIFWMINYGVRLAERGYFDYDHFTRKSEYGGVSKRNFAYKAVDFLIAQKIKGNFFNDFNSGAYLIGRTSPDIKVFIDGRTEVYGAEFFKMYQKIWRNGKKQVFLEYAAKYNLTGAFLNGANQQIPTAVVRLFYSLKDWELVYFDYDGMIFLKDIPVNQAVIARYAINLKKWQSSPMDLARLGTRRIFPFHNIDRARVLVALNMDEPAIKELNEALKIDPSAVEAYQLLGDAYAHQKKFRKAFENFRIASMMMPENRRFRLRLAWGYEHIQDLKNALIQYKRLLELTPNDVKIKQKIAMLTKVFKNKK